MTEQASQELKAMAPGPGERESGTAAARVADLPGTGRVVTLSRELPGAAPEPADVLQFAGDGPRGAWQRDGAWSVHGGAAVVAAAPPGPDRFDHLLRGAGRLSTPAPVDVRWFGGFSFHDRHLPRGAWSDFPAGRFVLPEWELRRQGEGRPRLIVHAVREPVDDGGRLRRRAAERLDRLAPLLSELGGGAVPGGGGRPGVRGRPGAPPPGDRRDWLESVEEALRRIRAGALDKVVLARELVLSPRGGPGPVDAYRGLQPGGGSTLFLHQPDRGDAFVGASPELLASLRGDTFRATAVAGSIARRGDPEEDEALARRLLESTKDRREQAIVAEEIRRCLKPLFRHVEVDPAHLLKLPRIQHLESRVVARAPQVRHVLSVLAALHPTPAVCGRPRRAALDFLREREPFERGWYAGPVGWFDGAGDGRFVPGLRSALLHGRQWRLYAGAGIVPGSEPEREWEETGMKFRPMLDALGIRAR